MPDRYNLNTYNIPILTYSPYNPYLPTSHNYLPPSPPPHSPLLSSTTNLPTILSTKTQINNKKYLDVYRPYKVIRDIKNKYIDTHTPEELRSGYFYYSNKFSKAVDALNIATIPLYFIPKINIATAGIMGALNTAQF